MIQEWALESESSGMPLVCTGYVSLMLGYCDRLMVSLKFIQWSSKSLVLHSVTLFGRRDFTWVVKLK